MFHVLGSGYGSGGTTPLLPSPTQRNSRPTAAFRKWPVLRAVGLVCKCAQHINPAQAPPVTQWQSGAAHAVRHKETFQFPSSLTGIAELGPDCVSGCKTVAGAYCAMPGPSDWSWAFRMQHCFSPLCTMSFATMSMCSLHTICSVQSEETPLVVAEDQEDADHTMMLT